MTLLHYIGRSSRCARLLISAVTVAFLCGCQKDVEKVPELGRPASSTQVTLPEADSVTFSFKNREARIRFVGNKQCYIVPSVVHWVHCQVTSCRLSDTPISVAGEDCQVHLLVLLEADLKRAGLVSRNVTILFQRSDIGMREAPVVGDYAWLGISGDPRFFDLLYPACCEAAEDKQF